MTAIRFIISAVAGLSCLAVSATSNGQVSGVQTWRNYTLPDTNNWNGLVSTMSTDQIILSKLEIYVELCQGQGLAFSADQILPDNFFHASFNGFNTLLDDPFSGSHIVRNGADLNSPGAGHWFNISEKLAGVALLDDLTEIRVYNRVPKGLHLYRTDGAQVSENRRACIARVGFRINGDVRTEVYTPLDEHWVTDERRFDAWSCKYQRPEPFGNPGPHWEETYTITLPEECPPERTEAAGGDPSTLLSADYMPDSRYRSPLVIDAKALLLPKLESLQSTNALLKGRACYAPSKVTIDDAMHLLNGSLLWEVYETLGVRSGGNRVIDFGLFNPNPIRVARAVDDSIVLVLHPYLRAEVDNLGPINCGTYEGGVDVTARLTMSCSTRNACRDPDSQEIKYDDQCDSTWASWPEPFGGIKVSITKVEPLAPGSSICTWLDDVFAGGSQFEKAIRDTLSDAEFEFNIAKTLLDMFRPMDPSDLDDMTPEQKEEYLAKNKLIDLASNACPFSNTLLHFDGEGSLVLDLKPILPSHAGQLPMRYAPELCLAGSTRADIERFAAGLNGLNP